MLAVQGRPTPFAETRFAQYGEGFGSLRASGGTLGGGSETLLVGNTGVAACLRSGGDGGVPSSRGENLVVQEDPVADTIGFSHTQGLDHQASTEAFPTLRAEGGGHAVMYDTRSTVLFQQNQRDEVRIMPGYAGSLNAENGMHNTNFLVQPQEDDGADL